MNLKSLSLWRTPGIMIIMIGAPGPAAVPARPGAFRPAGVRAESAAGLTQESLWRYCIMIGAPPAAAVGS